MGVRDDHLIEDWILDTKPVIRSQSEADAVDFLVYHLEGAAEEELQLRLDEGKNTPEAVFRVLQRSFCEGLTSTQAKRKFFERRKKEKESIQYYSHSLMVLLSQVERLNLCAVTDKDKDWQRPVPAPSRSLPWKHLWPIARTKDQSLDVLGGAKYFSTMDMASAYN